MAYRITVTDKYKSRNGSYIAEYDPVDDFVSKITREFVNINDESKTADLYTVRIVDLEQIEEYEQLINDPEKKDRAYGIVLEEPWIFYNCTVDQMMRCCIDYLKEGNLNFPEIYNKYFANRPLTTVVRWCYPLYKPQTPIIQDQEAKLNRILRSSLRFIFRDMFGLNDNVWVLPINNTFKPNHWSWALNKAKKIAEEERLEFSDPY